MAVNPKLIDYVKTSLSKGVGLKDIRAKLVSVGWSPQDVDSAINSVLNEDKNKSSSPKLWLIPVIFIIVLGIIFAVIYFSVSNSKLSETNLPNQEQEPATQSSVIDCGESIDCLIDKSENCGPSKVSFNTIIDIIGRIVSTNTSYEIKGVKENKCLLYLKTVNQTVVYSDELVQQMLVSGLTQEQIEQNEQEVNKQMATIVGKDGLCKFNRNEDLTSLLQKQRDGTFLGGVSSSCRLTPSGSNCTSTITGDWTIADCSGEMFGGTT